MKPSLFALSLVFSVSVNAGNQIFPEQQVYVKKYQKQKQITPVDQARVNTDQEPDLTEGFIDLYNGTDLSGWTARGGDCQFEAKGGSIVGTCIKGAASTYLCTDRDDFRDVIFTAEVKWEVDGNSGIMFRARHRPGKKAESVYGPQVELEGFSQPRNWSGGIYGQGAGGWRYPLWLDAHQKAREALRKDAWNRVTILAHGTTVKSWVNGVPAAHWENTEYTEGFFGLQVHSGAKGTIYFRNIRVKELDSSKAVDLLADGDFHLWKQKNGGPVRGAWTLTDGVVHRVARGGDIMTKKSYRDFDFRFEWKISEAGNSGVKYRTHGSLGLEYQILDDEKNRDRKNPTHRAASLYDLVVAHESKPLRPVGEWNQGRIVAKGNQLAHWLNGVKVMEIEYGSDEWIEKFEKSKYKEHEGFGSWEGPILLQDHNDPVWFRNLMIREL